MSEETKVVLNHLLEYLQDKIDTGYHKIFYNDDMHDEKTIDCINAINNTLEEIERLNNIMDKFEKWLDTVPNYFMDARSNNTGVYIQKGMQQMIDMSKNKLKELKGSDKNE